MPFQQAHGKSCAYREGEMPPIIRLWLTTTVLLGSLMLISERLAGTGFPMAISRLTLVLSTFWCLLLIMRRWWNKTVGARVEPLSQILSAFDTGRVSGETPVAGGDEISKLTALVHRACSELNLSRETGRDAGQGAGVTSTSRRLSGNLRLAADHVESIRALLEVSQTHRQPIPRAAFQNLELVSKNLREIQRQLDTDAQPVDLEGTLQLR